MDAAHSARTEDSGTSPDDAGAVDARGSGRAKAAAKVAELAGSEAKALTALAADIAAHSPSGTSAGQLVKLLAGNVFLAKNKAGNVTSGEMGAKSFKTS